MKGQMKRHNICHLSVQTLGASFSEICIEESTKAPDMSVFMLNNVIKSRSGIPGLYREGFMKNVFL